MGRIGPFGIWELLIILLVVLLVFGPRRLPAMARGIGQSVREFRKGIREVKSDFESDPQDPTSRRDKSIVAESQPAEPDLRKTPAATG